MITTINNKHKKLNVPNLRFPEFQGEWEELGLSELLDFKNGLNPKLDKFGKGIKFISVMEILNNAVITYDCIKASVDVTEKELSDFSVEKGDILFQRSSETLEDVGRANVYMDDKTAVFGGFVIRGKKKGEYDPQYFNYLLRSPFARKRIVPMGAGAQHFNIGQEGLSKVNLHFAKIKEQKKIGKMFSLLDERIATQNKIIDKLQSLIKGIMVELQKQGVDRGTWKKLSLGDVLSERNERNTNLYQVFSVSVSQGIVNQVDYLGRSFAAKDTSKYNVVHYGDLVYTKSPTGSFPYGIVVSVSAMPPCTQSFIPLPLPHEYNLNDMIASKRYESVWNTFLKELTRDSAVTLSSLQKKWHVNRSGMKQWMRNNGLSVKEAKKHIHECRHYAEEGQMLPLPATAGNLFLPMTTDQPALQPESCDILSGVSLVFPDGTQVNIRRGSAQAVMSFLKLYQREDLPCLD